MKNNLLFPFFIAICLFLTSCNEAALDQVKKETTKASGATTGVALSDLSIYNLGSKWTNQNNETVALEALKGKPVLVSMVYTSCAFACPRTVADLQRIEKGLAEFNAEDFRILLVTIDPSRDKPAQLSKFARENNLNLNRWTLLTAPEETTQELAAVLNVKYRKALNGEFAHSNLITLLNAQGEIVHQQQGLGAAPEETIAKMKELLVKQ